MVVSWLGPSQGVVVVGVREQDVQRCIFFERRRKASQQTSARSAEFLIREKCAVHRFTATSKRRRRAEERGAPPTRSRLLSLIPTSYSVNRTSYIMSTVVNPFPIPIPANADLKRQGIVSGS